jgi:hypothetical protein
VGDAWFCKAKRFSIKEVFSSIVFVGEEETGRLKVEPRGWEEGASAESKSSNSAREFEK